MSWHLSFHAATFCPPIKPEHVFCYNIQQASSLIIISWDENYPKTVKQNKLVKEIYLFLLNSLR